MAKSRGMDAVIEKSSKAGKVTRKPALKRKGPGIAIMIAVGKPKPDQGMGKGMPEEGKMTRSDSLRPGKIAMLEARVEELEAKLAELDGDAGEMEEEDDEEDEEA